MARRLTVSLELMVIGAVLTVVPLLLRKAHLGKGLASLPYLGLLIFAAGALVYWMSDRRSWRRLLYWLLPMLRPAPRPWYEASSTKSPRRRATDTLQRLRVQRGRGDTVPSNPGRQSSTSEPADTVIDRRAAASHSRRDEQ